MMLVVVVRTLAILTLIASVLGDDDDEVAVTGPNGISINAKKQGARIDVWRKLSGNGTTGKVTFNFNSLTELKADGSEVTDKGKKKSYDAFIRERFTASGPKDIILANSNGINASCLTLLLSLTDVGPETMFEATVCATKTNGTLILGDENSTVAEGQLKFTVKISKWVWSSADSTFLDLEINIKIPPGQSIRQEHSSSYKPTVFSFGAGATANFSTQMKVDDVWKNMSSAYPKYVQRGANNYITIRFARFNNTAEYDPTVDPGSSLALSSKGSFTLPSSLALAIVCFITVLMRSMF